MQYQDDGQADMTTAEVMTTAVVAARFFKNCVEHARVFLKEAGYVPQMLRLSASRLNRRMLRIPEQVWLALFYTLAEVFKQLNDNSDYVVDSLPIAICDNYRIKRCQTLSNVVGCTAILTTNARPFAATSPASDVSSTACVRMCW
jgi:hypothetical protein